MLLQMKEIPLVTVQTTRDREEEKKKRTTIEVKERQSKRNCRIAFTIRQIILLDWPTRFHPAEHKRWQWWNNGVRFSSMISCIWWCRHMTIPYLAMKSPSGNANDLSHLTMRTEKLKPMWKKKRRARNFDRTPAARTRIMASTTMTMMNWNVRQSSMFSETMV